MVITLKFTAGELEILTGLAADQLFRREFIDSRLPGFQLDAHELSLGKELVQRMRLLAGARRTRQEPGASRGTPAPRKQHS